MRIGSAADAYDQHSRGQQSTEWLAGNAYIARKLDIRAGYDLHALSLETFPDIVTAA